MRPVDYTPRRGARPAALLRFVVVVFSGLVLCSPPAFASGADAVRAGSQVTGLIVAYESGIRPTERPGVATGSSVVEGVDLAPGDDIGFGLRTVDLAQAVSGVEAERIAAELETSGAVKWAEPDYPTSLAVTGLMPASTTQASAPWGLDRIDQRSLPLDTQYTYNSSGAGVTAYIVDTGIRATHSEFAGRVSTGVNAMADANGTNDCHGHGTHVAGIVGGSTYGVAKDVTLVPVRVLDCTGAGTDSTAVAGLNWVVTNHVSGPAVVNMSLAVNGISAALDAAVNAAIADGITVVVAAGNLTKDACNYSPSHVPAAITVNASTDSDTPASFSNFGSCSDIYAPGVSILSSYYLSDSSAAYMSGTSMASPHVAGAAARMLGASPGLTPAQVWSALDAASTTIDFGLSAKADPNKLIYAAPASVPAEPLSVTANAANASAEVSWSIPASDGGATISGYTARAFTAQAGGSAVSTCTTVLLTCPISSLANGTTYFVDVLAGNAAGSGPASSPRVAVTPVATTGVPRTVSAISGNASAVVSWLAPSSSGSPITGYQALAYDAASGGTIVRNCTTTGALSCTIGALVNGTTYHVSVRAKSALGWSVQTDRIAATPVASIPSVPGPVSATPANGSALVAWGASASSGSSAISMYQALAYDLPMGGVIVRNCSTTGSVTCTITNLANGTTYYVAVRAKNGSGWSEQSARTAVTPAATVPDVPRTPAVAPGGASATVSWTAPLSDGGSGIILYQALAYDVDTGGTIVKYCSTTGVLACTITGLGNQTTYFVAVRAKNAVGWSMQTARIAVTPSTPVTATTPPQNVSANPGSGQVDVSWTPPATDGGGAVVLYQALAYDLDTGGVIVRNCTTSVDFGCTITGLTNGVTYFIAVRAKNPAGWSPQSARVSAMPVDLSLPASLGTPDVAPSASLATVPTDTNPLAYPPQPVERRSTPSHRRVAGSAT